MFEWWYGSVTAFGSQSSIRGAKVQITVRPLEGLVGGRRQVEAARPRLEVVGVERVGPGL